MQIININDTLYADILANIFIRTAANKSMSRVCKQWYNIICDHPLIRSTIPSGDLTCAQVSLMPAIHYNSLTKKKQQIDIPNVLSDDLMPMYLATYRHALSWVEVVDWICEQSNISEYIGSLIFVDISVLDYFRDAFCRFEQFRRYVLVAYPVVMTDEIRASIHLSINCREYSVSQIRYEIAGSLYMYYYGLIPAFVSELRAQLSRFIDIIEQRTGYIIIIR